MCCKGFLGVTPCLHNSLGLAKSFAALKTTPLQTNPVLHKCPAPRPQLHALAESAVLLLSLDCTEEQGWFTPVPFPASSALCSCLARWLNPNSSGRGGRRNTPTAVKYAMSTCCNISFATVVVQEASLKVGSVAKFGRDRMFCRHILCVF